MKYTIIIPEPCHEKWHLMNPMEKGRFCSSCKKEVLDFTYSSTYQLAKILDNNENLCGRFRASQLNKPFNSNKNQTMAKTSLVFGIRSFLALCTPLAAQEKSEKIEMVTIATTGKPLIIKDLRQPSTIETVKGTVVDSDNLPLPGANILLQETTIGTQTDFDGNFQLEIPKDAFKSNKKLSVTYIGFETKEICLNKLEPEIRLELKLPMQEMVMGGLVVVRKWNIFDRIANLFRKKHKNEIEEPEALTCNIDTEQESTLVEENIQEVNLLTMAHDEKKVEKKQASLAWPNPASNKITLKYQMEEDGKLIVQFLPINGTQNSGKTLTKGFRKKGKHQEAFQLNGLQNGLYVLIINKNKRVEEHKILVERK